MHVNDLALSAISGRLRLTGFRHLGQREQLVIGHCLAS
jgi:hypothetical protein